MKEDLIDWNDEDDTRPIYNQAMDTIDQLRARNAELEAEVARLLKALEGAKHFVPFLSGYYKAIEEALEASDGKNTLS